MKKKFAVIGIVAVAHFALWWAIVAILKVSGFDYFTMLSPSWPSPLQQFFIFLAGVMSLPLAWLTEHVTFENWWLSVIPLLLLNSLIWGLYLSTLFYAVRQQIQKRRAS